jgi:hypothetical protein
LDAVIPELGDGGSDHLIVLVSLDDPGLLERLELFGTYADAMVDPILWVVAPVGDERLDAFQFEHQPRFQLLSAPKALVEALADALPAAFRVRDGRVTALWQDWPPSEALQADDTGDEDGAD